ncbi:cytoskeletal protein binding protein [Tulasnella sp. 419]|nr:cytoskeletal protein binding protein [Tulasnella sp. 419]
MELRFQGAENRWNERGIVKELFNGCDVENDAMNKLIFILWVRALLHILKGRHRYRRSIATSVRQRLSVVDRKPNIDQTAAEKAGFYSVITTSSLNKTLPPLPRISISSQSTGCGDISRSKMVEPTPYILVMKVLYDYTAQADDELSISEDALVFLLDNSDEEWSKVQSYIPLDQVTEGTPPPSGLVPAAYVEEATPIARATALYDYEATGEGEVSMKEDTPMSIYAREDEWILVKLDHPGKGKLALIGYVPANYVEENDSTQPTAVAPPSPEETPEPKASALPAPAPIAVPPPIASLQPSETVPVSHSSHVAATTAGSPKSSFDPIQTWSVSEIDGKGKKKKGTLGVGNAAIFFASESDKAPVQQWPSSAIVHAYIDSSKHKHVVIELSSSSEPMVFGANSKDTAEAIIDKIDISRDAAKASTGQTSTSEEPNGASTHPTSRFLAPPPSRPNAGSSSPSPKPKGVHWDPEPPSEIRRSEDTEYEDDGTSATIPLKPGEVGHAVVLYDFVADGEDELTVNEGEKLVVVDKEGSDEWWKCRSASGKVGVVPASYVDLMPNEANDTSSENDRKAAEETRLRELEERRERERQEEAQKAARAEQLKKEQQREQREQAEREKQIREQERQHQREVQNQDRQWAAEAAEASNSLRERVKKESNSTTKKTLVISSFSTSPIDLSDDDGCCSVCCEFISSDDEDEGGFSSSVRSSLTMSPDRTNSESVSLSSPRLHSFAVSGEGVDAIRPPPSRSQSLPTTSSSLSTSLFGSLRIKFSGGTGGSSNSALGLDIPRPASPWKKLVSHRHGHKGHAHGRRNHSHSHYHHNPPVQLSPTQISRSDSPVPSILMPGAFPLTSSGENTPVRGSPTKCNSPIPSLLPSTSSPKPSSSSSIHSTSGSRPTSPLGALARSPSLGEYRVRSISPVGGRNAGTGKSQRSPSPLSFGGKKLLGKLGSRSLPEPFSSSSSHTALPSNSSERTGDTLLKGAVERDSHTRRPSLDDGIRLGSQKTMTSGVKPRFVAPVRSSSLPGNTLGYDLGPISERRASRSTQIAAVVPTTRPATPSSTLSPSTPSYALADLTASPKPFSYISPATPVLAPRATVLAQSVPSRPVTPPVKPPKPSYLQASARPASPGPSISAPSVSVPSVQTSIRQNFVPKLPDVGGGVLPTPSVGNGTPPLKPFSYLASSSPSYLRTSTTSPFPGHSHSASKDLPGRPSLEKPNPNQTRVWHDRSGQFKVEAEFLGVHNGKVRLHKMNGVVIEVPEEKMSTEDMQIIERLNRKGPSTSASRAPPKALSADSEDNIPLGQLNSGRRSDSNSPQPPRPSPPPKKPGIDWFEFFLSAGCDLDDCTRYAHSFEREKMDEAVLPDLKADSLRALGLREGDIIRVLKKIEQKDWKVQRSRTDDPRVKEQVKRDEELAMQLQRQEYGDQASRGEPKRANTTSPSPGLFAGPQGALRNNTRRGRPTPTKSTTLAVDPSTLSSASDQLSRGGSPSLVSPSAKVSTANGASKPTPVVSGFDDDAWAPRPTSAASNKPSTPAPTPATTSLPPPAPPVPAPSTTPASAPAPALAPSTQPKAQEETPAATQAPQQTSGSSIQRPATTSTPGTSLPNEFDNLAKLGSWRPPSAPAAPPAVPSISPPPGFQSGMGMGANPTPIGSLLVAQQTGVFGANMPRGPLAPVPANEGLLRPLIPTNTGFSSFIPTRPGAVSSPPLGLNSPNYLIQQPTGASPLQTIPGPGFSTLQPHMTGVGGGMLGGPSFLQQSMPSSLSPFANPPGFQHSQLQSQPTGFAGLSPSAGAITNPGSSFISNLQSQPPAFNPSQPNPTATQSADTNPANVFASMKAGSFANNSAPQASDKYDALRPATAPQAFASQPTGWSPMGVQSQPTGFQPSMLGGQIGYQQTGLNQPGFQHGGGFPASNFGFSG